MDPELDYPDFGDGDEEFLADPDPDYKDPPKKHKKTPNFMNSRDTFTMSDIVVVVKDDRMDILKNRHGSVLDHAGVLSKMIRAEVLPDNKIDLFNVSVENEVRDFIKLMYRKYSSNSLYRKFCENEQREIEKSHQTLQKKSK